MTFVADLAGHLDSLTRSHRRRGLKPRAGLDFASNDYLGVAGAPPLVQAVQDALARGVPIGSGGSRLLRGNHEEHERLEMEAAEWVGAESALFFSSGYAANSTLLSTLPQRGDLIVYDDLVHASMHEGLRLARADTAPVRHNDMDAFDATIAAWRARGGRGRPWIAVESLYSMDGDQAPLAELAQVAARYDAVLIVDEAHATGVFGDGGRGLASALPRGGNLITVHTCGKALGCEGALICAPALVRDFLINRGRPFIFSTAPSPLMAAAVRAALRLVTDEPERRTRLLALAAYAERKLAPLGATRSGSQILPLILGDDARTMAVAERLQARGFDVRGIRPPTVPAGTARLRIAITLNIDEAAIDALAAALEEALECA
ncbi:8-amino-7-oxononanoate synthase [Sphingomonas sp. 7/4-4]|uniref:8-amino-7-oxononanoate synthase n=1 Tax=Sphingomonas sp. 7/4-4 TaxID=3018446 RepID=UPI0022F3DFE2|nr:8-amino-7-oxononanoate synthase [Sphingomonas sp. 7/4-4]WBY09744.1 8-amino-7-oxononanoate synthase [Sphingomonas sp. 7/4-4]